MMGLGASTAWMLMCGGLFLLGLLAAAGLLARSGILAGRPVGERAALPLTEPSPADLLRRRYALGEIDEDEYLRRLSGLSA